MGHMADPVVERKVVLLESFWEGLLEEPPPARPTGPTFDQEAWEKCARKTFPRTLTALLNGQPLALPRQLRAPWEAFARLDIGRRLARSKNKDKCSHIGSSLAEPVLSQVRRCGCSRHLCLRSGRQRCGACGASSRRKCAGEGEQQRAAHAAGKKSRRAPEHKRILRNKKVQYGTTAR